MIELSDPTSKVENLESDDGGRTWTFDVVAENGDTARYGLSISFAKDDGGVDEGSGGSGGSVDGDDAPAPNDPSEEPGEETGGAGEGNSSIQPGAEAGASGAHGREQEEEGGSGVPSAEELPATGEKGARSMVIGLILLSAGLIVLPATIRKVGKKY